MCGCECMLLCLYEDRRVWKIPENEALLQEEFSVQISLDLIESNQVLTALVIQVCVCGGWGGL